jgi:ribosomal protein S6--L-glutamate ligase
MQLAILSRGPHLYSTRRLVEAATARSLEVAVLDPLHCVVALGAGDPAVVHRGRPLSLPRYVIPRIGASITVFGLAVLRQLEALGAHSANASEAVARARDKLRSLQLLVAGGLAIPATAFARRRDELRAAIARVGGPPVVLKLIEGAQGVGVMLAESYESAESVLDALHWLRQDILIQAYLRAAAGRDVRVLVVAGRALAAMERQAGEGDFRANLHRGGSARALELRPELAATAERAAAAIGLAVAGVDLLLVDGQPLVLEVNASPGLEGIERVSGLDLAGAIVDSLLAPTSA